MTNELISGLSIDVSDHFECKTTHIAYLSQSARVQASRNGPGWPAAEKSVRVAQIFSRNLNGFGRRIGVFTGLVWLESSVAIVCGRGHVSFDSQRMSGT
jgi:hypothetical protein